MFSYFSALKPKQVNSAPIQNKKDNKIDLWEVEQNYLGAPSNWID